MNINVLIKDLDNLQNKIKEVVNENFGFCPNDEWFNYLLEERKVAEEELKNYSYEEYINYCNRYY